MTAQQRTAGMIFQRERVKIRDRCWRLSVIRYLVNLIELIRPASQTR